jgi:uracil-DNA glycosylase family 4
MSSKRAMAQWLKHMSMAGVTHLPKVTLPKPSKAASTVSAKKPVGSRQAPSVPVSATPAAAPIAARPSVVAELRRAATGLLMPDEIETSSASRPMPLSDVQTVITAQFSDADVSAKSKALCNLAEIVAGCHRCSDLANRRTQTVFGVGNPNAEIMLIGEAPGADEDAQGEPFVGPAGQLLNKIIEASQLKREDMYICNILRCRPPGNRNPLPQEAANCREFLDAQIYVVQPKRIICLGTVAAQNLLGVTLPVGKLRGKFFDYHGIQVMCTYHPSYLLRNPTAKKQVWEDMKFFMKELGVELK